MNYGLPYKGSKNKLAERIVSLLPKRTHLIDLFCGGCAIAHAALVKNKFQHIHINDINWMCPTLFIDALNGKYANDTRWISREDFHRLKDTDPYVAIVWSFGNNMKDYLYGQDIEPLKKAVHYAIFFSDYSLASDLGHDLSFIDSIPDINHKYTAIKRYFNQFGHFQQQSVEGDVREELGRLQYKDRSILTSTLIPNYGGGTSKNIPATCNTSKRQTESVGLESRERTNRTSAISHSGGVQIAYYPQCA